MTSLSYLSRPTLRHPVLLAAFGGWSDAGEGATSALRHLHELWGGEVFARIDPEEFFDFQQHRPMVHVNEEGIREITWPRIEFAHAEIPGAGRDVVILEGIEPSTRWATFTGHIVDVALQTGAELVIGVGALLAGRPHTRAVRITGAAATPDLAERFGLQMPRYEGPTGILGVLMDACRRGRIDVMTFWGWVPHYLQASPSPAVSLALLQRISSVLEVSIDLEALEEQARSHEKRISEIVGADPDIAATVAELERQADLEDESEIPSGEELAEQIERYLRDQRN